jgi:hypothetical protein
MQGHVKGLVLREFLLFCEQHDDRTRVLRALGALDRAYPNVLDPEREGGGVLSSKWYQAELVHVLIDAIMAGRSEAERDALASRAAHSIMKHTLSGVYRFMFSTFATPVLYAKHANKLWQQHYDSGQVLIDNRERQGLSHVAHVKVLRWLSHHDFICRMHSEAAVPIYEAMGCTAVRCERIACLSAGAAQCEWLVHWQ